MQPRATLRRCILVLARRPLASPVVDRSAPWPRPRARRPRRPGRSLHRAGGSGKTTTLVARVAWLVATGVDPATITTITFNARAAEELRERLAPALEPLGVAPDGVRVRTFHALGLEILRDAGRPPRLISRDRLLRRLVPEADPAARRRLDDAFSRLKLDLAVTARDVAGDRIGHGARASSCEAALAAAGAWTSTTVAGAIRELRAGRRSRRCVPLRTLLVDEDWTSTGAAELAIDWRHRPTGLPRGDDDQSNTDGDSRTCGGPGLASRLPGLRRVDLEVNYRCPAPVPGAVRLVEHKTGALAKGDPAPPPPPPRWRLASVAHTGGGAGAAPPCRMASTAPQGVLARSGASCCRSWRLPRRRHRLPGGRRGAAPGGPPRRRLRGPATVNPGRCPWPPASRRCRGPTPAR